MRKPGETRGRKRRDQEHRDVSQVLQGNAMKAVRLVTDLVTGSRKRCSQMRYSAAIFVIEQVIGKSRIKVEHSGEIQTSYSDLARSAEDALKDAGFSITREGSVAPPLPPVNESETTPGQEA